jgi:hypothetical protein
MGETVDVLVVGMSIDFCCVYRDLNAGSSAGNYGSGKRSGGVSTLICAVFDDQRSYEDDDEEPKYVSTIMHVHTMACSRHSDVVFSADTAALSA